MEINKMSFIVEDLKKLVYSYDYKTEFILDLLKMLEFERELSM
jgi:hypothetical protein